ncbi:uncharacterized protein LOC118798868 [Colossoma macropomum]|uniref:uncharacterized protein LOC118798868 n=1 Tax=Colossoma macropomum TaxID=42526 RepID=UPI001864C3CA|nr:uncharacterized protein LOC118798868 [Colossoma macropomum]
MWWPIRGPAQIKNRNYCLPFVSHFHLPIFNRTKLSVKMAVSARSEAVDGSSPPLDFTAGPFVTQRSMNDIIDTLSQLYICSDDEEEISEPGERAEDQQNWLPPPPPPVDNIPEGWEERLLRLENKIVDLEERLPGMEEERCSLMTQEQEKWGEKLQGLRASFEEGIKALENRLGYHMDRWSERLKKEMDLEIQELGRSVVDCFKRRDVQLEEFSGLQFHFFHPFLQSNGEKRRKNW